jgi:cytochrome P450
LMAAGNGTTLHQLGHALTTFMAHPQQWQLLADHPALAVSAAEEVVRFAPASLLGLPRVVKADFQLHDRHFAAGDGVLPVIGSANRDPRAFADPDRFDIARSRRQPPLSYGGGPHYCLGAALARLELREVLPLLADRLSEVEPAGPAEWLPPSEAVYGPVRLPIRYRPRV